MATQMQIRKKWIINAFSLSILLHLLFLFSFSVIFFVPEENNKVPNDYVPAYTYHGAITPTSIPIASDTTPTPTAKPLKKVETSLDDYFGIKETKATVKEGRIVSTSMMAASKQFLKQEFHQALARKPDNSEPMMLIGDQNEVADPLVKMIGRALSAHFKYPKQEGMFGIKGQVVLAMTVNPDGYFTDVQIVKSSHNAAFDAAALYAVNSAPKIAGITKLLPQPKRIVVGFIFS
ncbi:MAG: TonB family protein [Gammaproteobacteria bacterium]